MMQKWNVYIDGEYKDDLIDSVFFDSDLDEKYVRDSLINHDGYASDITIEKAE